jgi:endonuclease G, mitochondrial
MARFIVYQAQYGLKKHKKPIAYSIGPTDQRVPRRQKFIPDPAIASDKQASTLDYRQSDYDRGHMISPADLYFKGPIIVQEAFYVTTLTPQTPWLNRKLWLEVEVRVRDVVQTQQQLVFVVAGPLFLEQPNNGNNNIKTIGPGKIPVPTHFFRIMAIATPGGGIDTFSLIVPNLDDGSLDLTSYLVSISEIEEKSGLTLFPLLDAPTADKMKIHPGRVW